MTNAELDALLNDLASLHAHDIGGPFQDALLEAIAAIRALRAERERLREALQGLHDDIVEYVTLNNLHDADGSPAINNHWMNRARTALGDA